MNQFDTTHPPLARFRIDFLRLIWLAILFLILPVFFIASGVINLQRDGFWFFPFVVLPVGISIYRVILIVLNLDLEILLYEDGFSYTKNGETRRYSWKEIDKVWTVRYELLSIIYIKYVRVKILDTSGKVLILDRTLRNVDQFETILQAQIARDKFPQAIALLQQGKELEFAGTIITKDHIKNEHDAIRWSELGDLQMWQGSIRLWKKGKQAISIMASVASTPNFGLLLALIQHLSSTAQASPIPVQAEDYEPNLVVKPKPGIRLKPGGNTDARLSGLFFFILGAGLGYWQIVLPIRQALQQQEFISYSSQIVILVPITIFMGLFLLVFGADGLGFLSKPTSKVGFIFFLLGILVFVLGCYFGMQFIMKSLGYG
jgi:hypothetical protein